MEQKQQFQEDDIRQKFEAIKEQLEKQLLKLGQTGTVTYKIFQGGKNCIFSLNSKKGKSLLATVHDDKLRVYGKASMQAICCIALAHLL